jgi:hypothetical protein
MIYNAGNISIGFPVEAVRKQYADKSVFVSDMLKMHRGRFDEGDFKKILDTVWSEAYPETKGKPPAERTSKKSRAEETPPVEETNEGGVSKQRYCPTLFSFMHWC